MKNIERQIDSYPVFEEKCLFDWLSSWKKWNRKLEELREKFWVDIVTEIRKMWKTPLEVERILKGN